jgi:tetratricopeptide (TPR) repeat protein
MTAKERGTARRTVGLGLVAGATVVVMAMLALRGPTVAVPVPDPDTAAMQPRVIDAVRAAREAVVASPGSAAAWGRLGAVCDAHEIFDVAATSYDRARALDPDDFRWPYLLAFVRELQGAPIEETRPLFEDAARLEPRSIAALCRLGDALARAGRHEAARMAYERALALDKNLPYADRGLGQALLGLGRPDEAMAPLERAIEVGGEDGATLTALARAAALVGADDRADAFAARARDAPVTLALPDPVRLAVADLGVSSAHCEERARRLMRAGRFADAIGPLEIVLETQPGSADARYRLGVCHARLGRADLALGHLARALELRADHAPTHYELGGALIATGSTGRAMTHLRRAVDLAPDAGTHVAALAEALARTGRLDEAIAGFQEARRLGVTSALLYANWGTAVLQRGDAARAVGLLSRSVDLRPDHAQTRFKLGMALERTGRVHDAIDQYRMAAAIDPRHVAGRRLRELTGGG